MGEATSGPIQLSFNPQLRVEFGGATVTSDAGLLRSSSDTSPTLAADAIGNSRFRISFASPSTVAWRATRTPTTWSGWPWIRRFGC